MKLLRAGKTRLTNEDGTYTYGDAATAVVTGTTEELNDLMKFMEINGYELPAVEPEVYCFRGSRATPILIITFDFQAYKTAYFKDMYKLFTKKAK